MPTRGLLLSVWTFVFFSDFIRIYQQFWKIQPDIDSEVVDESVGWFFFTFDLTDLGDGQDQERSSSAGFNDDRQELWVDGAEGTVPRHLGDADVIVGLLGLDRLAEDVAELALPHNAATHGCGREGEVLLERGLLQLSSPSSLR